MTPGPKGPGLRTGTVVVYVGRVLLDPPGAGDKHVKRRRFLETALQAAGAFAFAPAVLRQSAARPLIAYGTASGDITGPRGILWNRRAGGRGIVWSRTDRPARMLVEWATSDSFQNVHRMAGSIARDVTGFTARAD